MPVTTLQDMNASPDILDSGQTVSIRDMSLADLPEVMQIEQASFAHPWNKLHFLSSLYKQPVAQCWVAVTEERIVGFIIAWYISRYSNETGEMHIHNIAVLPEARRKGVGRQLLKHAVEYGNADDCDIVSLEVRAGNETAQQFYRRHGFAKMGVRPEYYGDEDALVMEADIQTILTQFQTQE